MEIIKTFQKKGLKGKAHIVSMVDRDRPAGPLRLWVMAENHSGYTECPIYVGGMFIYEHPERLAGYVRDLVWQAYTVLKMLQKLS